MVDRISSFEELHIWQKAIDLAVKVYELSKKFPDSEQFGITSQVRRSASSVSANIAEGFGRSSRKEKIQFNTIAYGSLLETKSFLYLTNRLGYISDYELAEITDLINILQKQVNSSTKAIKFYA